MCWSYTMSMCPQTTLTAHILNASRVMTNKEDDVEGLQQNLDRYFSEGSVKVIGCIALFWARK